jgi:hypothetical protein
VTFLPKRASAALVHGLATILLPALLVTAAYAATDSTSIEPGPSTWESFGSRLRLPHEGLNTRPRIAPPIRLADEWAEVTTPPMTLNSFVPTGLHP